MRSIYCFCLAILISISVVSAQDQVTDSYGFNTIVCPSNSDTIVGVPFRANGSRQGTLAAVPVVNGDFAELTITGTPNFTTNEFANKWYVKFGNLTAKNGNWYTVTANTANTVTINLNGDSASGMLQGDSILLARFWTLDELFPPAGATTAWTGTDPDWEPNGHAIVASTNTLPAGRRTEILLADTENSGINLAPTARYYINAGIWKLSAGGNTNRGPTTILYPDTHFRIRNPSTVIHATKYKCVGEVSSDNFTIPLSTLPTGQGKQDNYIAIPRPINVTLEQLNLRQSGAFVASTNTLPAGRKDELYVFDNAAALINKAPSAIYYVHNGIWKLSAGGNTDRGTSVVIPAGAGFIIRKYETADGATVMWNNTPNY